MGEGTAARGGSVETRHGMAGNAQAPLAATLGRLADYQRASDLFHAARDAAIDIERTSRTIASLQSKEGVRAQGYGPSGRGGVSDPMRATDVRVDYEERVRSRREENYALIDLACAVIYGSDQSGSGGVDAMLGPRYADTLWWRYCAAATWAEVAEGTGMSERWCRDAERVAFDEIDAYGILRMAEGNGLAEG